MDVYLRLELKDKRFARVAMVRVVIKLVLVTNAKVKVFKLKWFN